MTAKMLHELADLVGALPYGYVAGIRFLKNSGEEVDFPAQAAEYIDVHVRCRDDVGSHYYAWVFEEAFKGWQETV